METVVSRQQMIDDLVVNLVAINTGNPKAEGENKPMFKTFLQTERARYGKMGDLELQNIWTMNLVL